MVGLSVILESNQGDFRKKSSQVISKSSILLMNLSSSSSKNNRPFLQTPSLRLEFCFLCKQKLLPGNDIYMYKGDRGFCSVECRCRQILMDEEESVMKDNCRKTASSSTSESSESSSSSSMAASSSNRKTTRNRRGQFATAY
ncbi:FCS-Like Zinc finger 15 [Benincasa hispida]|uniref:FCS-Like Zinc finger 15 n=1 Tax=Benincasa hispida TaxID=102211 RepID=UPI001902471D|nr:FCS-Like Zinc finger 15 [Benincasa hispida]